MPAARSGNRRLTIRRTGPDGETTVLHVRGSGNHWTAWSPGGEAGRLIDADEVRALVITAAGGLEGNVDVDAPPLVIGTEELRELTAGALEREPQTAVPDSLRPVLATLRGIADAELTTDDDAQIDAVSWLDGGPAGCWVVEPAEDEHVVLAPGDSGVLIARLLTALEL